MEKSVKQSDRYTINSIEKAMRVLEVLSDNQNLNLIELSKKMGIPKSSLYRVILTLEKCGFVSRSEENGNYCLGYKLLVLTRNLLENNSLRSCAINEMKWLADRYKDTVNLGVKSDGVVLYTEIIEGTYSLRMNESVGSTAPFHASAVGKAILAFLPENEIDHLIETQELKPITSNTIRDKILLKKELYKIKKNGYATDKEEVVLGARCIAAPIFNMFGKVEAAISLSGASHRFKDEEIDKMALDVKQASQNVSKKLGFNIE